MTKRRFYVMFLPVAALLFLLLMLAMIGPRDVRGLEAQPRDINGTNLVPPLLRLNLGPDDPTLDPSLSRWHDFSSSVINQLFLGLVRIDEESGAVIPELATTWEASPDARAFTFTLRSDVTWTNGDPVTAEDVRYGLLRSLDPDIQSPGAFPLFVIQNAQAYNEGTLTDTAEVGVTVVDDTHLRFDLQEPAAYLPSIMALPTARPLPAATVAAHPDDWTEPAHIVTNGPYELASWAHGEAIILRKRPDYYDAANVQIETVLFSMVDHDTAWEMYQAGQLDSVYVSLDQWRTARGDAYLRQALHRAPRAATYHFGFDTSKAPFDDAQVRQAFVAAVNRQDFLQDFFDDYQFPALTFTPPGVLGHMDGAAEGIGIPHDPAQAQQCLADAGYPDGQGLPPITLMHTPGSTAISQHVRQSWADHLSVTVALSETSWSDYLDLLQNDPPQVWSITWRADYRDAYNFLHDAIYDSIVHSALGEWNNATYKDLLDQAAATPDLALRHALYKQAEETLVETEALMLPYYYAAHGTATQPYLERTYDGGGWGGRIADWRLTWVRETIGPAGGTLTSYDGSTTIHIPPQAITGTILITHTPAFGIVPPGSSLKSSGNIFELTTVYSSTAAGTGSTAWLPAQVAPGHTYTLTARYTETEIAPLLEGGLGLYGWDPDTSTWSQEGITSSVNVTDNLVTAQVDHFSRFGVLGTFHPVHLPLILRAE